MSYLTPEGPPLNPRPKNRPGGLLLRWATAVLVAINAFLHPAGAGAHRNSVSFSTVEIADSRTEIRYRLKVLAPDAAEILGLAADQDPSDEVVAAGEGALLAHAMAHIVVSNGDQPCPAEPIGARVSHHRGRFIEIEWRIRCSAVITALAVEYHLFFDLDPQHRGLLRITYGERATQPVLTAHKPRFVWHLDHDAPSNRLDFLTKGIEHIVRGFDHIAFLLGLLLVVVIVRRSGRVDVGGGAGESDPSIAAWSVRSVGESLRSTVGIVTSFTLAHSITLVVASLGWASLPGVVVESIIAASIIYVAVENVARPHTRHRVLVTFGFGLIHGMGFASQLQAYLPPVDVAWPLVMFNVGVELGQLAIVICVLPMLYALANGLGERSYRMIVMPLSSAVLAILGLLWLIERIFEVTIVGF